jgi:hypothetical protein
METLTNVITVFQFTAVYVASSQFLLDPMALSIRPVLIQSLADSLGVGGLHGKPGMGQWKPTCEARDFYFLRTDSCLPRHLP